MSKKIEFSGYVCPTCQSEKQDFTLKFSYYWCDRCQHAFSKPIYINRYATNGKNGGVIKSK